MEVLGASAEPLNRRRHRGSILLALLVLIGTPIRAEPVEEYRLKGAFLYNFAKFVEWPKEMFESRDEFSICIVASTKVVDQVDDVLTGKTVRGRAVAVKRLEDPGKSSDCHILFVAAEHGVSPREVGSATSGGSTLTVGESGGFSRDGGMIGFAQETSRLRFEINRRKAREAGLTISSKLLKLASEVHD